MVERREDRPTKNNDTKIAIDFKRQHEMKLKCNDSMEFYSASEKEKHHKNGKVDEMDSIMESMKMQLKNANVQEHGCRYVFKYLISEKSNIKSVSSTGMISSIFSAMMMHPKNGNVQQYGCAALGEICFISDHDRSIISKSGVIPLVLKAMTHHPKNEHVSKQAYSLLGNLCAGTENVQNCISIHANNGVGLILKSMHLQNKNPNVQEKACYALSCICRKNKLIISTIKAGGCLYLVAEAMKKFLGQRRVQIQSCSLLSSLCYDQDCRRVIANGEVIHVVLDSLKQHQADTAVVKKCLSTFCHVSGNQNDAFENILDTGCLPMIATIMDLHPSDIEVQKYCYHFLRNLSTNPKSARILERSQELMSRNTFTDQPKMHPSCIRYIKEIKANLS